MSPSGETRASPRGRDPGQWHIPLLLAVSSAYEGLFIRHGILSADEGWSLYAAMSVHAGGTLYEDAFWVFPPGALLPSWLALAIAPPGVVVSRLVYAGFSVLLCIGMYALGRRLMSPTYALLGALLVAVAAPSSHLVHVVFGYRYLFFGVMALICFSQRLRSGSTTWTLLAGGLSGVALLFRLTPAVAVCAGIVAGILAMEGPWRAKVREGVRFIAGGVVVVVPVLAYLATTVGIETLWREIVVRPVAMTRLQALSVPTPALPTGLGRWDFEQAFATWEFWIYPLLYLGVAAWLTARWRADPERDRPPDELLLLSVVVSGAVFLLRSYGRADTYHLESAIPPVCLLIAWLAQPRPSGSLRPRRVHLIRVALVLTVWVALKGADLYVAPSVRGTSPVAALGGRVFTTPSARSLIDPLVEAIERHTDAGASVLDLGATPLLHVLTGRPGVGGLDIVLPGTFLSEGEELAQLERIMAEPPAAVVLPRRAFDGRIDRAVPAIAPRIFAWVTPRYALGEALEHFLVLVPVSGEPPSP